MAVGGGNYGISAAWIASCMRKVGIPAADVHHHQPSTTVRASFYHWAIRMGPYAALLCILGLLLVVLLGAFAPAQPAPLAITGEESAPDTADALVVEVGDNVVPYSPFGIFVMPGERLPLRVVDPDLAAFASAEGGRLIERGAGTWTWTAPDAPGLYPLTVRDVRNGRATTLNVFVKRPFDHQTEWLNGYRIGRYAQEARNGNEAFLPPPGFVEVTPEVADVPVSPHFTLGQFLCKQRSDFPKYVLVDERLLLKLEQLLEQARMEGLTDEPFHIMSAFRTPYYNRKIGNRTTYSSHLYGMAADIFIDTTGDGRMDDLTGSGRVTVADAHRLAEVVDTVLEGSEGHTFEGGLGIYAPRPHRGPFIHVDVRGERARW